MKELSALCETLGFKRVRTYIQSGNVIFESSLSAARAQDALERALAKHMGKKIDVILRSASELRSVLSANPFPDEPPAKVAVLFCADVVQRDLLAHVAAPGGEKVVATDREIYVFYPNGMGRSKLKLPSAKGPVTARNINTVTKLVALTVEA